MAVDRPTPTTEPMTPVGATEPMTPVGGGPIVIPDQAGDDELLRSFGMEEHPPNRIDEHHEIQLDAILRDELSLTEPMVPLCRPDCPGLCPECGERLDRGSHAHGVAVFDPRLAGLAKFRPDDGANGHN